MLSLEFIILGGFGFDNMAKIVVQRSSLDDLSGGTIEERAKLVLCTLGRTAEEIKKAYRRMAVRYHPDKMHGDEEKFKLVTEAYELLGEGRYPKRAEACLLANDLLITEFTGRNVAVLDFIKRQREFVEYEKHRREQFYGKNGENLSVC